MKPAMSCGAALKPLAKHRLEGGVMSEDGVFGPSYSPSRRKPCLIRSSGQLTTVCCLIVALADAERRRPLLLSAGREEEGVHRQLHAASIAFQSGDGIEIALRGHCADLDVGEPGEHRREVEVDYVPPVDPNPPRSRRVENRVRKIGDDHLDHLFVAFTLF